jgi:hypothetical protein
MPTIPVVCVARKESHLAVSSQTEVDIKHSKEGISHSHLLAGQAGGKDREGKRDDRGTNHT